MRYEAGGCPEVESFDAQAPKIKENFLWACATLAADCERMIDQLDALPLHADA